MRQGDLFLRCYMDLMSLLKTVPAVIGIAGLLTYLMRPRAPVSDQDLVNVVQRVRNTFLLLGCAALIMLSVAYLPARATGSRCRASIHVALSSVRLSVVC